MATAISSHTRGSDSPENQCDRRITAFCSPRYPDLFHAFAYASDIWKHDPFDVESIHRNAREKFERIVTRVIEPSGLASGRILLLLGESGCGKTHLMRAFRNQVHSRRIGYCGYLQMSAYTDQYSRYVLNNLVDSLDKPYEDSGTTTGLMRLSNLLAEFGGQVAHEELGQLREGALDQEGIDRLVGGLADRIVLDERFSAIDVYLVQVLLYLQLDDSPTKARVLKYLRCEDLTLSDRRLLGGIVPCTYSDAPQRLIQRLGELMWVVERVPLILCVDQLEEVFDLEGAPVKFRRAIAALCDLVSRLPSAIVVIACLDDFYNELKKMLTRPIVDRVENDPPPVDLRPQCNRDDVERLIAQRLKFLYESLDVSFQPDQPTYPLPETLVQKLVGLRARDVLGEIQVFRERCIEKGKMTAYPPEGGAPLDSKPEAAMMLLEQAWNEFRSTFTTVVPVDEAELAILVAAAIRSCSDEVEAGLKFDAEADGRMVEVERHDVNDSISRAVVGVCNKASQGGALGRQIAEVVTRAGKHTPVIVRSTDFPGNPKAAVSRQIGELITGGGRCVVVQDSDWRVMVALSSFHRQHGTSPSFRSWLTQSRPLTTLTSVRTILDLERDN